MKLKDLVQGLKSQNHFFISRAITIIESEKQSYDSLLSNLFFQSGYSYKIGITGPPGAGKSTMINGLISHFRKKNLTIAVLSVDPSSPFSGGAILGDRIRMNSYYNDDNVFIRSISSRGSLGGISEKTDLILEVFDSSSFDVVLVETVGVGQVELDVMDCVDCLILSLVPESGDDIQTMKAGLMEVPDIFVVNKSDRPGAKKVEFYVKSMLEDNLRKVERKPPVIKASYKDKESVKKIYDEILSFWSWQKKEGLLKMNQNERYKSIINNNLINIFQKSIWTKENKNKLKKYISSSNFKERNPIIFSEKLFNKWIK